MLEFNINLITFTVILIIKNYSLMLYKKKLIYLIECKLKKIYNMCQNIKKTKYNIFLKKY